MYMIYAFITSSICTYLLIRYSHLHQHFSGDIQFSGPQKFHVAITPRIGGLSIFIGFLASLITLKLSDIHPEFTKNLILCSIPVFGIGFAEDIFKCIKVNTRILTTALSALIAIRLLGTTIETVDIRILDILLNYYWFAVCITIFAVTGLTNAYNIIDGFNGLSSMTAMITLLAMSYVCHLNGDNELMSVCLSMTACIFGFFIFNFPKGLIFLGDGGAYLIGYIIAQLSILLTIRNSEISPWFIFLINLYPITETLFSIYRRFKRKVSPGAPDGIHFHTLIYRRVLKIGSTPEGLNKIFTRNSKTAPIFWIFTCLSTLSAICFWRFTPALIFCSICSISAYLWTYTKIVRYQTPSWLNIYR